ncbi:MAG TPA: ABC transporter permease subunit [Candidatus Wunengus sp. YC60]|uniref:ABC transporter permease subunit n=1 Tax=Candidatus Wunengus sp. YC60 TaxID=3367697 RepID=UPI004026C169
MKSLKRRKFTDRAAYWAITFGGAATVFVVLALFLFIFLEVYPLLKGAKVSKENTYSLQGKAVAIGVDEHQGVAYAVYQDGKVEFVSLSDGKVFKNYTITGLNGSAITSVDRDNNLLALGTSDGKVLTVSIKFSESFENEKRTILPEISEEEPTLVGDEGKGIAFIAARRDDSATVTVACTKDGRLILKSTETKSTLFGAEERKETRKDITSLTTQHSLNQFPSQLQEETATTGNQAPLPSERTDTREGILAANSSTNQENKAEITSLALDHFMENLYAGTSAGEIFHINVKDRENPFLAEKILVSDKAVTALGFLLGDVSLVVGDYGGGVNVWMQVRDEASPSGWVLKKVHTLKSHHAPVAAVASSLRDKGFVTAASDGSIHLNHATSEQTLLNLEIKSIPAALAFSPKANGILVMDSNGNLRQWDISNPHPEATLKTLFGKIWYEGYEKPEFVWQSTGGTDDFEPKLSLVPLIFGTIKGTIYAMLIAVPIGILAALYTSQFLHSSLKIIKPVIEVMAALPSVILGFLAGLWLAPLMERIFPALVVMPFFIVLAIAAAFYIWKSIPARIKGGYRHGTETLFLIPFIIGAVYASVQLSGVFETVFFGGDYRQWLFDILGLKYDQRNAIVVGFAMGFAVIPLIFTISEDAISNVPNSLVSASLALGATPWQTAVRVVLPAASPGIFSAVMIGFGRAVGETMIVLMATGNTPIMDWNLFNGFRALAANIAVEIPEAPFGGTLYRVLFLAALLLFITTFTINTLAEMVRQRMRRRYSKL